MAARAGSNTRLSVKAKTPYARPQKSFPYSPQSEESDVESPRRPRSRREKIVRYENGKKVYVCDMCGKTVSRSPDLNRHMLAHGDPKFKCRSIRCTCLYLALGEIFIDDSVERTVLDGSVWAGCYESFTRRDAQRRHLKSRLAKGCCSDQEASTHLAQSRASLSDEDKEELLIRLQGEHEQDWAQEMVFPSRRSRLGGSEGTVQSMIAFWTSTFSRLRSDDSSCTTYLFRARLTIEPSQSHARHPSLYLLLSHLDFRLECSCILGSTAVYWYVFSCERSASWHSVW